MNKLALTLAFSAGVCCVLPGYTINLSALPVVGGQASPPMATSGTVPAANVQFAKSATVRVLDKQTNKMDHVTLEVGKSQKWSVLNLSLQKCAWGLGGVPVQDAAWLDLTANSGEPEFHGWMFNTFPSVSTYDHPRYDVELEKCVRPAGYVVPAPARVAPPTPSGPEHENSNSAGDDEAPSGNNPGVDSEFVVPGIPNGAGNGPAAEAAPVPMAPAQPVYGQPAAQLPDGQPVVAPQAPPAAPTAPEPVLAPGEPMAPMPEAAPTQQVQPASDDGQLQRMMDVPAQPAGQ